MVKFRSKIECLFFFHCSINHKIPKARYNKRLKLILIFFILYVSTNQANTLVLLIGLPVFNHHLDQNAHLGSLVAPPPCTPGRRGRRRRGEGRGGHRQH